MKPRFKLILHVILTLSLTSCRSRGDISDHPTIIKEDSIAIKSKAEPLPNLETTIVLSDKKQSELTYQDLSEEQAKFLLYRYFEKKGIAARAELKSASKYPKDRIFVDFDTIYPVQSGKYSGAIVSYWLGAADLNGHCFQPTKAFIVRTTNGYKVTNEGFIPTNFTIDSVIKSTIYGYEYDCGGRGIVRYLRVNLQ